jgi:hypothetical protein
MGLSRNNVSDKGQYIQLQETDDQVFYSLVKFNKKWIVLEVKIL